MIALLAALPVLTWDFSSTTEGFVPSGDTLQWEHGEATAGPVAPGGPVKMWGTNLSGPYLVDATDSLESPVLDLTGVARPTLVFLHWYNIVAGDAGTLEVDPGTGWVEVEPVYGYPDVTGFVGNAEWTYTSVDLSAYGDAPRIRFTLDSDLSFTAPGWYLAEMTLWDGDATAPVITVLSSPVDNQQVELPHRVQVDIEDDAAVAEASLVWSTPSASGTVPMTLLTDYTFDGYIPAQPPDTVVSWHVEAADLEGNASSFPATGEATFRVYLGAPTALTAGVGERGIGEGVTFSWTAPSSPHPVTSYLLQDTSGSHPAVQVVGTTAEVRLEAGDPRVWHVAAQYDVGVGDWSEPVAFGLEVPELSSVEPAALVPGDTVHLSLEGSSLYLLDGVTALGLGGGIEVLELDVLDAGRLVALVSVAADAEPGPRAVVVDGAQGTSTFEGAIEVSDTASIGVTSVSPSTVRQGDEVTLTVVAGAPFAGPVQVTTDADLVVSGAVTVSGAELQLPLAVLTSATPGEHFLALDDGLRVRELTLVVEERTYTARTGACSSAPAGSSAGLGAVPMAVLALLGACVRRRPRTLDGSAARFVAPPWAARPAPAAGSRR